MRSERLYLVDMTEAADAIAIFIASHDRASFLADYQLRSAVVFQLIIIGEAADHVSPELRARNAHVEWQKATGLRHYAAHGYFALDWNIIWDTAIGDVPPLRAQIEDILTHEYSG